LPPQLPSGPSPVGISKDCPCAHSVRDGPGGFSQDSQRRRRRHEPGRRFDGQTHDAFADGQALSTIVRAAALPDAPRKDGEVMSEGYDWSADIAKLPMPVLLVFADNDSISQKHIAEFFALLGGGGKLGAHAVVEVAACGRAGLQPLQFHQLTGGSANCRQVPGRSAHQSANRRSSSLAGRAGLRLIGRSIRFEGPMP